MWWLVSEDKAVVSHDGAFSTKLTCAETEQYLQELQPRQNLLGNTLRAFPAAHDTYHQNYSQWIIVCVD